MHTVVDDTAGAFDLAEATGFEAFLKFMYCGCAPLEAALTRSGAENILAEWPERQRAGLLAQDLGIPTDPKGATTGFRSPGEIWGALYVLEGSRIGARMLARTTPLAQHSRFFVASVKCGFWPDFLERLAGADARLGDRPAMSAGAKRAFASFIPAPIGEI